MVKRPAPEFFSNRIINKATVSPVTSTNFNVATRKFEVDYHNLKPGKSRLDVVLLSPLKDEPVVKENIRLNQNRSFNITSDELKIDDEAIRFVQLIAVPTDSDVNLKPKLLNQLKGFFFSRAITKVNTHIAGKGATLEAVIPSIESELTTLAESNKANVIIIKLAENQLKPSSLFRATVTNVKAKKSINSRITIKAQRARLLNLDDKDTVQVIAKPV